MYYDKDEIEEAKDRLVLKALDSDPESSDGDTEHVKEVLIIS